MILQILETSLHPLLIPDFATQPLWLKRTSPVVNLGLEYTIGIIGIASSQVNAVAQSWLGRNKDQLLQYIGRIYTIKLDHITL